MRMAHRIGTQPGSKYVGLTKTVNGHPVWTGEVRLDEAALTLPLRWRKPRRIFVDSMSDLFHEVVPDEWIDRVFAVMALSPKHTFIVLTKRAERMRDYCQSKHAGFLVKIAHQINSAWLGDDPSRTSAVGVGYSPTTWPLSNVWLGVSVEDQQRADERIPLLLEPPAAIRFVSAEPLLAPINLLPFLKRRRKLDEAGSMDDDWSQKILDWVIVGGESGPGARPMHPEWARSLRDQCAAAGAAFFFKQWGAWAPEDQAPAGARKPRYPYPWNRHEWNYNTGKPVSWRFGAHAAGRALDGREWSEWPA